MSAGAAGSGRSTPPVGDGVQGRAWWIDGARALARRPGLWPIAMVELAAMAPRRWWRHWPPAPVVSEAWLEFRMETAYGDRTARPTAPELVSWLEWCKVSRRRTRLR